MFQSNGSQKSLTDSFEATRIGSLNLITEFSKEKITEFFVD
jgi:hypothetical protein